MIDVLLKPPQGSPKTRLNTADRIGAGLCFFDSSKLASPLFDTLGNTPLHLAMESAHAEAASMLIDAGADRSRVCAVSFQRRPYHFVPNRVIVILNLGKPGQRDPGASSRCRWPRAEACQGVCCVALRPGNVTLARVQKFTVQYLYA